MSLSKQRKRGLIYLSSNDKGLRTEKIGYGSTLRYTYDDLSVINQSDQTNLSLTKYGN